MVVIAKRRLFIEFEDFPVLAGLLVLLDLLFDESAVLVLVFVLDYVGVVGGRV